MSVQARKARPAEARKPFSGKGDARAAADQGRAVSLEVCLYLGAVVMGAALRLLLVDLRPLSVDEGTLAAESYRLLQAQPPESLHQGPLLAYGTTLMLAMFGGGDGAARLLPALFGSALVAASYLLRRVLGRGPALLAAYGLALSPVMVFASDSVGSAAVALTLGLLLWLALEAGTEDIGIWRAGGVALLLSGLLASGTEGVTVVLALGFSALLSHPQPSALAGGLRDAVRSSVWRRAATVFVGSLLVVGTGLGGYLPGLQWAVVDVWTGWVKSFSLATPRATLLAMLALYELPVLILGIVQLVRTILRRDRADMFLAMWAMILLLMGMVQGMTPVSRVALPLLPIYLLAARFLGGRLAAAGTGSGNEKLEMQRALALLVPVAVAAILLNSASLPDNERLLNYLYVAVAIMVLVEIAAVVWLTLRSQGVLVWGAVAALCCLSMVHTMVFLNLREDSLSLEPLAGNQVSPFLRDAAADAAYYASYYGAPVMVDPQLRAATVWYLRQVRDLQFSTEASQPISLQLAPPNLQNLDAGSERRPGLYAPAVDGKALTWQGLWRWLARREGLVRPNQRDIIVRAPAGKW